MSSEIISNYSYALALLFFGVSVLFANISRTTPMETFAGVSMIVSAVAAAAFTQYNVQTLQIIIIVVLTLGFIYSLFLLLSSFSEAPMFNAKRKFLRPKIALLLFLCGMFSSILAIVLS